MELSKEELDYLRSFQLLTLKPVIYIANISDDEIADPHTNPHFSKVEALAAKENCQVVPICADIEEQLSGLDKEEKMLSYKILVLVNLGWIK